MSNFIDVSSLQAPFRHIRSWMATCVSAINTENGSSLAGDTAALLDLSERRRPVTNASMFAWTRVDGEDPWVFAHALALVALTCIIVRYIVSSSSTVPGHSRWACCVVFLQFSPLTSLP